MTENRSPTLSEIITDGVVFWERGRVIYNLALVGATKLASVMASQPVVGIGDYPWGALLLLAVLANVLYTSGYVPDFLMQNTPWRATWRHMRWGLWLFGTGLSVWLANNIAQGLGVDWTQV